MYYIYLAGWPVGIDGLRGGGDHPYSIADFMAVHDIVCYTPTVLYCRNMCYMLLVVC